ncbi:TIGR03089 family protein [Williamsia herbipolensis]|uniref:TIGR03089 family protein n=1 Tax=Williamsia herbipolensis TaxID=1603258 RepID=A0AAU4K2D9_9NOCA|nr:TIGR03089 family protein [Williamsia herbipolensis]
MSTRPAPDVATVTDAVFGPALATDPASPLFTFYDDASGERTELSTLTAVNWAAKTANFLRDEIGVAPGDRVAVDLPEHWQTFTILLGAWWAGAEVVLGSDPSVSVAFCAHDRLDAHADVDEVVVAPLDPFALPVADLPIGVTDFGSGVRVHGDQFAPIVGGPAALDGRTVSEIVTAATARAAADTITAGSRVMSTCRWDTADGLIRGVLATPVVGGSLVHVSHADAHAMAGRADTEKATVSLS